MKIQFATSALGWLLCSLAQADIINVPGDQPTIQAAINVAVNGDEIIVAPGRYLENIIFLGKAITVRSIDPNDQSVRQATIIDGGGSGSVVTCFSGEGPDTVLNGLTITGGAGRVGENGRFFGGGMYNLNSSPSVANCRFISNVADMGGGMFNNNSSVTVTNCTFFRNNARIHGAGMYNIDSSPTVFDCFFYQNPESGGPYPVLGGGMLNGNSSPVVSNCGFEQNNAHIGGGMCNFGGRPEITKCSFFFNTASFGGGLYTNNSLTKLTNSTFWVNWANFGGGLYIAGGSPQLAGCVITDNIVTSQGGGLYNSQGSPVIMNCTISVNWADIDGGGIFNSDGGQTTIVNSIVWRDTPDEIVNTSTASTVVTYSDVMGGYPGIGNIDADPLFFPRLDTFQPQFFPSSPCIDAGNSSAVPAGLTTDIDGHARLANDPNTPDTGIGPGPVVDMGAHEFIQRCTVDVNGDQVVNVTDLLLLLGSWGDCPSPCPTDTNGDGIVNVFDLLTLLAGWGVCS